METRHGAAFLSLIFALACGGNQAVQLNQSDDLPGNRWQGTVSSPPTLDGVVEMNGTAWMAEAEEGDTTTVVQVAIQNAAPGGLHPWEVRRGQCGTDWGVLGDSTAYEPLEVSNQGRASASATVSEPLPDTGEYSVAILASPSNEDLIVACANLAPPVAGGFR
jgi:hypothetical protein